MYPCVIMLANPVAFHAGHIRHNALLTINFWSDGHSMFQELVMANHLPSITKQGLLWIVLEQSFGVGIDFSFCGNRFLIFNWHSKHVLWSFAKMWRKNKRLACLFQTDLNDRTLCSVLKRKHIRKQKLLLCKFSQLNSEMRYKRHCQIEKLINQYLTQFHTI